MVRFKKRGLHQKKKKALTKGKRNENMRQTKPKWGNIMQKKCDMLNSTQLAVETFAFDSTTDCDNRNRDSQAAHIISLFDL